MKLSLSSIGTSNNATNFLHKLILTNNQVSQMIINGSSAKIKFFKTQLSKIVQLGEFLFGPPNIFGLTIKEIISPPANSIKNSFVKELKNKDPK